MRAKPFIAPQMEVRTDHGTTFIKTAVILSDPELQTRCVEQRELRRIMNILRKQDDSKPSRPVRRGSPRKKRKPI